jgi:hypothetical protein
MLSDLFARLFCDETSSIFNKSCLLPHAVQWTNLPRLCLNKMSMGIPTPKVRVAHDAHVDSPIHVASCHPKMPGCATGLELPDGSACVLPLLFLPYQQ